jgi:hydrogenase nickel incorporation protein HypA/HybF
MHEYSIAQALYDGVMTHATARGATSIQQVHVRIGELSGVDVGLLDTAWRTFRVRTPCADADMTVQVVAARWGCRACGTSARQDGALRCANCQGPLTLAEGDEILLDRIVMEVP